MSQWKIAVRSLIRRPAFAAAVVALLSLGIGVNTALLSLVYTVLIKPLPYPAPELLVTVFEASAAKGQNASLVAPARLEDWNRLNSTFEAIAGSYTENVTADDTRAAALRSTVWNWLQVRIRQLSAFRSTKQLRGSMVAWAR